MQRHCKVYLTHHVSHQTNTTQIAATSLVLVFRYSQLMMVFSLNDQLQNKISFISEKIMTEQTVHSNQTFSPQLRRRISAEKKHLEINIYHVSCLVKAHQPKYDIQISSLARDSHVHVNYCYLTNNIFILRKLEQYGGAQLHLHMK